MLRCVQAIMEVITLASCLLHSTAPAVPQAGCNAVKPAAWPHPLTLCRFTAAGPAHCHMEKQTPGNKMMFVYKVIESIWLFLSRSVHPHSFGKYFQQA